MVSIRALDPARRPGARAGGRPAEYRSYGVTLLIAARLLAWLIALAIVLGDERPSENSAHEPLLLILSLALILAGGLYVPLAREAVRRMYPGPVSRDRDLLALSAVDMAAVVAIFVYSGGFNTPYYHYGIVALVVPVFLLGWRDSLLVLAAYLGAMVLTWIFAGAGLDGPSPAAPWHEHLSGYGTPGRLLSPVLVVLVGQYLAWLARRLEDRERATAHALEDTALLFRIAQASTAEDSAAGVLGVAVRRLESTDRFQHASAWAKEEGGYRLVAQAGADQIGPEFLAGDSADTAAAGDPLASTALRERIAVRGREWGCLLVRSARGHPDFEGTGLLESVASQVALGITRIELSHEQEHLAAETERMRIAREIHDGIAQSVYMLALSLEKSAGVAGESTPMGSRLTNLVSVARQALIEIRHYMFDLKPLLAGDASLASTVRSQAKEFQTVASLPTEVVVSGEEPELPVATQTVIYRMVQEALANAFRHARASKVKVRLHFQAEQLVLEVEDDGRGFDVANGTGRGIENLRQRCEELAGRLAIMSGEGAGTRVSITLPLGGRPEDD